MVPPTTLELVQATLAPLFLVTGVGIYVGFLQTRLFRAIDRIRAMSAPSEDVGFLRWRIRLLRNGIALAALSMALTVLAAAFILANEFVAGPETPLNVPALVSLGGALLAFAGSILAGLLDTVRNLGDVERIQPEGPAGDGENVT